MEEEIDIKELVSILWNKKNFIIGITLFISFITFISYILLNNVIIKFQDAENSEIYYAETHFIIGTAEPQKAIIIPQTSDTNSQISVTDQSRIIQTEIFIDTYREMIKSKSSLDKIIEELNLDIDANRLASSISFSNVSESNFFSLTVLYNNKEKAVQIAEKLMEEFINNMSKAYPMDKVSIIDEPYLLSNSDIASSATASQLITPKSIAKTSFNSTLKYTIVAAFIGFVISSAIILFKEIFNNTIKTKSDLEKITKSHNLISLTQNRADDYNQMAVLRVKLDDSKDILVTSPERNDNLIYVADNLADSLAKNLKKVLLIDLNFARPILVKKYNLKSLLEFATSKNSDSLKKIVSKSINGLFDIIYMDSESSSFLTEAELKKLMTALNKIYDVIVVNADNLFENAHGLAISKIAKNTLIVATENVTTTEDFQRTSEFITSAKEHIFLKYQK